MASTGSSVDDPRRNGKRPEDDKRKTGHARLFEDEPDKDRRVPKDNAAKPAAEQPQQGPQPPASGPLGDLKDWIDAERWGWTFTGTSADGNTEYFEKEVPKRFSKDGRIELDFQWRVGKVRMSIVPIGDPAAGGEREETVSFDEKLDARKYNNLLKNPKLTV